MSDKPATEDREDVRLLIGCQWTPLGYPMPFLQAAPAAGCGPVLSDEDRVVPHRCLLAVIRWIGGGETLVDEFLPVQHHGVQPFALQVFPFSGTKPESATEGRTSQPLENLIQIAVHLRIPLRPAIDEDQGNVQISRHRSGTSIGSLSLSIAS